MIADEDVPHLEPAFRRYAKLSDADRIAWIQSDRWIAFDQAQAAIDRLDALLAYPPRDRMPCLLIYGATGMGKTKILRKFERRHPAKLCQTSGVTLRPVVVAQIPPEPVERDLYREMLAGLQAPALAGGSLAREKDVCRALLRSAGVRMIVLDEVNGMLVGTHRQQRIFLNALRFLANDLKIPLVCAGTDLAPARLLRSLASILPLRTPSELENAAVRERILALTDGVTARIFRLIETAAVTAIRSGKERLDLESFAGEDLVLPLVSMTQAAERRAGRPGSHAARR